MLNLTKIQKNDIFKVIENNGLSPHRFSWEKHQSKFVSVYIRRAYDAASGYEPDSAEALVFKDGNFIFTFERDDAGIYYSSVNPQLPDVGNGVKSKTWNGLIGAFENWLKIIKFELQEPDLWAELPRGQAVISLPSDYSSEEKFSIKERQILAQQLSKIQQFIIDSNQLGGAEQIQVRQTFIYLQQRADTTSKLDWKNLFAGAILGLILEKSVSNAPEIMRLSNELLTPFFQKLIH